jgi:tetratricopeptide (TPR) repeat protein
MLIDKIKKANKMKLGFGLASLLISFIVYLSTMAPTVSFWDCGEFIACSATLSVPHPPGAPLFLLFGRMFAMIPFSSDIAFRTNLMSVVTSAATIILLYYSIVLLIERFREKSDTFKDQFIVYFSAFIGAMAFAFSDSQWFNAVETEVYGPSTLLTALTVWLVLKWDAEDIKGKHGEKYLLFLFYTMGIAIGIHLLNILAIPFIVMIIYFRYSKFEIKSFLGVTVLAGALYLIIHKGIIDGTPEIARMININPAAVSFPLALLVLLVIFVALFFIFGRALKSRPVAAKWSRLVVIGLILITMGYSSYEMIFIRSLKNPGIDENDPETVSAAVSYLHREQYGQHSWAREDAMAQNKTNVQYKGSFDFFWRYQFKQMYIRYFNWQYIGRAEGGGVGWSGAGVDIRQLWALPFLFGMIGAFFHFSRDWKRAFPILILFIMTGVAIVLYVNNPDPQPRERDYSYVGSFFTFAIWIGVGALALFDTLDKWIKKKKLKQILIISASILLLVALPMNLLLANYESHSRKGNYVASDYAYNLLNSCEKDAILFTNGDNDTFPLWYMQEVEKFRTDVKIVNLSLLNTPWYIKQLKNVEPKIPLRWTDAQIETIRPVPWKTQDVTVAGLTTTVKPTYGGQYLRVQDLMIFELIRVINWETPIYFAVTVSTSSRLGLDDYLSMEGQVMKLYKEKVKKIDEDKIFENFTTNYRFRNLNNPDVYFSPNTQRLMQNYRTAVLQATMKFIEGGRDEKARELLNSIEENIPEAIIPQYHPELSLQTGRLLYQLGDTAEYTKRIDDVLGQENLDERTLMMISQELVYTIKDYNRAEQILLPMYRQDPYNNWVAGTLVRLYRETGDYGSALNILGSWLKIAPNDHQAQALKTQIEALANE